MSRRHLENPLNPPNTPTPRYPLPDEESGDGRSKQSHRTPQASSTTILRYIPSPPTHGPGRYIRPRFRRGASLATTTATSASSPTATNHLVPTATASTNLPTATTTFPTLSPAPRSDTRSNTTHLPTTLPTTTGSSPSSPTTTEPGGITEAGTRHATIGGGQITAGGATADNGAEAAIRGANGILAWRIGAPWSRQVASEEVYSSLA